MQKWEYKIVPNLCESVMNELGQEGWELVRVVGGDNGSLARLIFKRPVA